MLENSPIPQDPSNVEEQKESPQRVINRDKQQDSNSCGYYAMLNAVKALDPTYAVDIDAFKGKSVVERVSLLGFDEVLKSNNLQKKYHVIAPYTPTGTAEERQRQVAETINDPENEVFIGFYEATITNKVKKTTSQDRHFALLHSKRLSSTQHEDLTSLKVKCSAAGKEAETAVWQSCSYGFDGATQKHEMRLLQLLVVKRGPKPESGVCAWFKNLCCCSSKSKDD